MHGVLELEEEAGPSDVSFTLCSCPDFLGFLSPILFRALVCGFASRPTELHRLGYAPEVLVDFAYGNLFSFRARRAVV